LQELNDQEESIVSAKVYVGNLPYGVRDNELKELFASFGEITEAVVITEKHSGRSKGFGFVTFAEDESAKKAVSEMNGKDVQGRELKVSEARPMEER
jgi:cold-inducible RNA-binding protein